MPPLLDRLQTLVSYTAGAIAGSRHDRGALRELEAAALPDGTIPGLPSGLEVKFLGVAGFTLSYESTTIAIDPYVTRFGLAHLLRRRPVSTNTAAVDRWIPRCDAILVGHTHFDHAFDVPAIALRDRCNVYGGASVRNLMGLFGRPDLAVEVEHHRPIEIGPFTVTFVPSVHSKLALGGSVPYAGEITCEHLDHLTPQAFRCGQVWGILIEVAGAKLYHQGSADLLDDELPRMHVDAFLCGVAGRQFTNNYLRRILPRLDPASVVVCHHDDFLRGLDDPLSMTLGVNLASLSDEVAAVSRDSRLLAVPRVT